MKREHHPRAHGPVRTSFWYSKRLVGLSALAGAFMGSACGGAPNVTATAATAEPMAPPPVVASQNQSATVEEATAFVAQVNGELRDLYNDQNRRSWIRSNFVTYDTEKLAAAGLERTMEYLARKIKEARRFEGLSLPPETARSLYLLKFAAGLPAPADPALRKELSEIASQLESIYSKGKYCSDKLKGQGAVATPGKADDGCRDLQQLDNLLAKSHDYATLLEAWKGWHSVARPMRPIYERFVQLGNQGAKELGFADMGEIWKGRYDMAPDAFVADMDRLWGEVKPLYEQLHCYMRSKLRTRYGKEHVADHAPIPAHLLGNMWAQEWSALYDLVEPYKGKGQPDLTKQMLKKGYTPEKMVRTAEGFFTSLGMQALPATFYERSLLTKPRDRDVECHASAWDLDMAGDVRIKMCIQVKYEDLVTVHHELGHNYYFLNYNQLPVLFQDGANDGFHEGIGDTLALSVTPSYMKQIGLLENANATPEADINLLMLRALEGVAFLPFGKLIDQWRFDVFNGKVPPGRYNAAWWELRQQFQGVSAPEPRSEADFDPGAKYHIPGNTPYTRYFIARILQYQLHRALCQAAGHQGPLHQCSIYGNKAAGQKLIQMLQLGASKPWAEALATVTGETKLSATAILDYYAPLYEWLKGQNKSEQCGW